MDIVQLRGLALFIIAFLNLGLALILWYRSKDDKAKFWLGVTALFSGLYAFFCGATYFFWNQGLDVSVFWYKTTWLGVLILPCFVIFTYYFTGRIKYINLKILLIYTPALLIALLANTTDYFVKSLILRGYNISSLAGNLDPWGRAFIFFCLALSVINLLRDYAKTTGFRKLQIRYFILGTGIFSFAGIITTAIIPFFIHESPYYDIAAYLSFVWVGLTAYAILKYRLLDVRVIAVELFTFALWVILFLKIFLSTSGQDFFVNISIFIAVLFFGFLLIIGVMKEVRQKEEIEKLAMKLEKAYEVEKKANEELKRLDETKNQFLIQTQHDLRSPLSVIRGYCDLIIGGVVGKQTKKTVEIMHKIESVAGEKIRDVNNFLDITQFRLGKGIINLSPNVNLNAILQEIIKTLKFRSDQKKISLNLEVPKDDILITADKEKIKSAIYNITDNAIKYTEKGSVSISVLKLENLVRITIKDTGIGIPKDKLGTIFEDKFERTEGARKTAEGKGIGLYLAGQIIKLHKGTIKVESAGEVKGSTFIIELPF